MKAVIFFGVLFVSIGWISAQETLLLMESHLNPVEFHVGDEVELRLLYQNLGSADVYLPDEYPEQPLFLIRNVQILPGPNSLQIFIRFVPYAAGTRSLPRLKLGDLLIDNFRIHTKTTLNPEDVELQPPRESLLLPYTEAILLFLAFVLFFAPLLTLAVFRRLREPISKLWHHWVRKRPYKVFMKDLKKIRSRLLSWNTREFYTEVSRVLRQYTSSKCEEDHQPLTSTELSLALENHFEPTVAHSLLETLVLCDQVVYGGVTTSESLKNQLITDLEATTAQVEVPHAHL